MTDSKVKLHLHLKSELRDSYDSFHTAARATMDISPAATVEQLKFEALACLGEFAELGDVHHTRCRFICGTKTISADDDGKNVSELGLSDNAELHVILPIGHDSVLVKGGDASQPLPASPKVRIHIKLKSEIRDSYDSIDLAGKAEIDVFPMEQTVEQFKANCFGALGEIEQLADVHHTKCKFNVGGMMLGPEYDSRKVSAVPQIKDGVEVHIMLPMGHDSVLAGGK